MSQINWKTWLLCGAMAASPLLSVFARADEPPPVARAARVRAVPAIDIVAPAEDELSLRLTDLDDDDEAPLGEYWLGVVLGTLPDVARQQLNLDHGLVVAEVHAESPAAKAGVKKHDILTKAGDTQLKAPGDLVKAVNDAKEQELPLTLLRGGKEIVLKATPIKRTEAARTTARLYDLRAPKGEIREEIKRIEEALQSLKLKEGGDKFSLLFARPGVVAPNFILPKPAELPKGMAISISKEGDKPAKIHVKKDDQEWDVTEDKLGDLPEDIRGHVQKFLQGMTAPGIAAAAARGFLGGPKVAPYAPVAPVPPVAPAAPRVPAPPARAVPPAAPAVEGNRIYSYRVEGGNLEGKLDTIVKKLDELRKDVDELKGKK